MKKYILTFLITFTEISFSINAQVGINQSIPKANLDIKQSTETTVPDGFLVPRMALSYLENNTSKYSANQNGTLIYINSLGSGSTINQTKKITSLGFYYYNASANLWERLITDHGNGNFTPTVVEIDIPASGVTWWTPYINSNYNYFLFRQGQSTNSSIKFPLASDFVNKTIYIRNASAYSLTLVNLPTNLPNTYPSNSGYMDLGQLTALTYDSTIQCYSDGNRWYLMSGRN